MRDIAATPRPTGSAAIAVARARCAAELRDLGYDVREAPFEFSEFSGRLATPLLGGLGALLVGVAGAWGASGMWGMRGMRFAPSSLLVASALALVLGGRWLTERGVLAIPVMRQRGVNLEAARPGEAPRVWLCAHLDTKSQPVPTLVRSAGLGLEIIGFLTTFTLAAAAAFGAFASEWLWSAAAAVTLVGAIPVVLSMVGSRSPGALDNASGVATVIAAARELGKGNQPGIGVLITDAEELALAGARVWGGGRAGTKATVLNCDGVDDTGRIYVMFTRSRPSELLDAVARASTKIGVPHHSARMAFGFLTDSVAFAGAGLRSVTFSRGSVRSLARVHSRRDDLAHLRGDGIAETAKLIAATAREIR